MSFERKQPKPFPNSVVHWVLEAWTRLTTSFMVYNQSVTRVAADGRLLSESPFRELKEKDPYCFQQYLGKSWHLGIEYGRII